MCTTLSHLSSLGNTGRPARQRPETRASHPAEGGPEQGGAQASHSRLCKQRVAELGVKPGLQAPNPLWVIARSPAPSDCSKGHRGPRRHPRRLGPAPAALRSFLPSRDVLEPRLGQGRCTQMSGSNAGRGECFQGPGRVSTDHSLHGC